METWTDDRQPSRRELRAFRTRKSRGSRRTTRVRRVVGVVAVLGLGVIALAVAPALHPQAVDEAVLVAAMSSDGADSAGAGSGGDPTATSDASTPNATDPALVDPETGALAPVDPAAEPTAAATDPAVDDSVSGATRGSERVEIAPTPDAAAVAAAVAAQFATELVDATNAERSTAGLAALTVSECATGQALARAGVLVAEDRFEHDPLGPVLEACGGSGVGENLALGYATPAAMMAGWMASEGHRLNILRAYTSIGIGCVKGAKGMLCAQVFLS